MAKINQPLPWGMDATDTYVPISHEGKVIGFCKPDYASSVIDILNEVDKLQKALDLACYDLVARSGGSTTAVTDMVQQYLEKAERPKSGTALIALLLEERRDALDLTDEEFAKFCDTFKLSRDELKGIYANEEIESAQLTPLSRILGMTVDELIDAWKGQD